MPFAYVLYSVKAGHFYTGATTDLTRRILQHNSDQSRSTKNRGSWILVHQEELPTLAAALRREKYFKSGKGREGLQQILTAKRTPNI